jgi:hypothetical protein
MTVHVLSNGEYEVEIRTVHCNNTECMNPAFGEFAFQSPLKSNTLSFRKPGCAVSIRFVPQRATVHIDGCAADDAYPYGGPRGPFVKFSSDPEWATR